MSSNRHARAIVFAFLIGAAARAQTLSYIRTDVTTGYTPLRVAIADFKRNGKPDIAYLLSGSGPPTVSVLPGYGLGRFLGPITTTVSTGGVRTMAVGDVNNDQLADVITFDVDANLLCVLLGNSDGTFQSPKTITNTTADGIAIGDFNGDGKPDLATTTPGSILIYLGNGDGTFATANPITIGIDPLCTAIVADDFNKDGKIDLAVVNMFAANIDVLLGNGDGTFASPQPYALDVASAPQALAVGDINGDGLLDLVVAETSAFSVAVLLGNGDGTFKPPTTFGVNRYVYDVAILPT